MGRNTPTEKDVPTQKNLRLGGDQEDMGGGVLTAGADVALVAVEKAVSNPDVCPRGCVS